MNDVDWVKENVTIFLDENIPFRHLQTLINLGYKVENVYTLDYKGANDGQILDLIKEKKMILVTYDKKFYKMAMKYNKFAILITNPPGNMVRVRSIISIIKLNLYSNIKVLQDYYNG